MTDHTKLLDIKVNVKIVLSGMWVALMFCYVYGDFFTLFVPGHIDKLNGGEMGLGETTPGKILIAAIVVLVPALMVALSLILPAILNRWLNMIMALIYTAIMILVVMTSIDPWWLFYIMLGIVEIFLTSLIFWVAVKWPREG